MMIRQIYSFKTMHCWLTLHPEAAKAFGFVHGIPDRTTLLRRYKKAAEILPGFIDFVYRDTVECGLETPFHNAIYFDSSFFRACGNVWHAWDKAEGKIPKKLRKIDKEAEWGKSGYHQFIYGYKIHVGTTENRFPICIEVGAGNTGDSPMFDKWEDYLVALGPDYIVADNAYCKASRVHRLRKLGIFLVTPGDRWTKTKPAQEYHRLMEAELPRRLLAYRKLAIEPVFDLLPKLVGALANHKQLSVIGMDNVRPLLLLGFLALQMCMRLNLENGRPRSELTIFMNLLR